MKNDETESVTSMRRCHLDKGGWGIQTPKKEPSLQIRGGLKGRALVESGRGPQQRVLPSAEWRVTPLPRSLPALWWKGAAVQALPGESRGHIQQGRMCKVLAGNEWACFQTSSSHLPGATMAFHPREMWDSFFSLYCKMCSNLYL